MFISIPKEFFVPVLFGDNYTLNLETQNMEFDTERIRENRKKRKKIIDKKIHKKNDNGKIYVEIDDEYVNSMTGSKSNIKTTRLKDDTVGSKDNIYKEIDDDYVNEVRRK